MLSARRTRRIASRFQSFWVNGFGWKFRHQDKKPPSLSVSILLSQWIWLEVRFCSKTIQFVKLFQSFWVNGFGWKSPRSRAWDTPSKEFQSFWVNGFGWKQPLWSIAKCAGLCFNPSESMDLVGRHGKPTIRSPVVWVSILLSQWIWLEGKGKSCTFSQTKRFNPSESMDLVGSHNGNFCLRVKYVVSILLSQWIWLEGLFQIAT